MARQTLILAKNIAEANRYARELGMQRFTYRAVRHAGSIRGVRHAEVHLLSTFLKRPDRHAIMSALRQAKTLEVFYADVADFPGLEVRRVVVGGHLVDLDKRGELTERQLEVAYRFNALRDLEESSEPTGTPVPSEDPAPAPVQKRRTRCAGCGELHFKDEPCTPEVVAGPAPAAVDFF